jgi:16S rRNA (cytidine1402-2'-O)-methyltransferase
VVATPIGNARDITLRAIDTLKSVDLVACEDTRVTAKLLVIHGIRAKTIAYHDHNAERVRPLLIERLKHGESVALVADAGTPLVSDPGYKLVRAALEAGVPVTALPGPSAVLTALVLSGLPTDRFLFAGFPPAKTQARRRLLAEVATVPTTLVFMESPQRLAQALADMATALGPREAAVARELTKMFEEVRRGPLPDLAAHYAAAGPPKGEVTIVVAPPGALAAPSVDDVERRLVSALTTASVRDAADQVAAETGLKRRDVYARALRIAARARTS